MTALASGDSGNFAAYVGLVGPMVTYLLPLLIANTGGRMVYDAAAASWRRSRRWVSSSARTSRCSSAR
jgi:hypothetical protein